MLEGFESPWSISECAERGDVQPASCPAAPIPPAALSLLHVHPGAGPGAGSQCCPHPAMPRGHVPGTRDKRENQEPRGDPARWARPMLPHGLAGTGLAKECSASPPAWGKKIAHIICCRLRAKSCSFYLQPLTWTRLLIWVKETRLWPPDNFKVLGFMLLASLRNVCKCWRALLDFRS